MMNENALVNTLYNPNDRLGVALLGSSAWNELKNTVAKISKQQIVDPWRSVKRFNRKRSTIGRMANKISPVVNQLMGFNDAAGVALLGSMWSNLKDNVTSATHTALNVGKQIPITSGLVDTLRDVGSYFKWGSKASSETDSAIDAAAKAIKANKIKTALILGGVGVGAAFLIYYMGKKK